MKRFLVLVCLLCLGFMAFRKGREFAKDLVASNPTSFPKVEPGKSARTKPLRNRANNRSWTFNDGSSLDAVLVAASAERAQLRLRQTQLVHSLKLNLFAKGDRNHIQDWVRSEGRNGVAGHPIRLKSHSWPDNWRGNDRVSLQRVPDTNLWKSPHFDITNNAGINQAALESIASICESVDGALNALPLPLPVNWGRPSESRRKVVIERNSDTSGISGQAGYWDGQTGIVHINTEFLFEHDTQMVVFEFDKPKRRQKYDTIVHEVTHQSTAALMYLGVPAWVSEGIAEYMAAMQHSPSAYHFGNSYVSARYHINKLIIGDRIIKDRKMHFAQLKNLMNRDLEKWNATLTSNAIAGRLQYDEALLLVDYFCHCDHPNGLHFNRYLQAVLSGVSEEEAQSRHLMRGRSYEELETELTNRWKGLGFTINFQNRGEIRPGDATVDWKAEDVRRSMAARRAFSDK